MDIHKLITRYRQFGGFRLVLEYARLGILGTLVKAFVMCLVKRQSFKQIYPEVLKRVEPFLVKRYAPVVSRSRLHYSCYLEHKRNKIVWLCCIT